MQHAMRFSQGVNPYNERNIGRWCTLSGTAIGADDRSGVVYPLAAIAGPIFHDPNPYRHRATAVTMMATAQHQNMSSTAIGHDACGL